MASECLPADLTKIMHARLVIGDDVLMMSDSPASMPYQGMKGFMLSLSYDDADEGRRIFAALADGGTVTMPIQSTFWAAAFGMLTDRFGIPWMVSAGPVAAA